MSITHFHEESWNPIITVRAVITSLILMMTDESTHGLGIIKRSIDEKIWIAMESCEQIVKH